MSLGRSPYETAAMMQQLDQQAMMQQRSQMQNMAMLASQGMGLGAGLAGQAFGAVDAEPYDATQCPQETTFGEIVAWRSWRWKDGALVSPYKDTRWSPGEILKAHESPFKGRSSGIFCHKTVEDVFHQESDNWNVVGTVLIWGDVLEHEKGYRAEFAKPLEMIHIHPNLDAAAKQYIREMFSHHD